MSFGVVASVAGAVGGALITSSATKSAAKKQQKGTDAAIGEQARQYDQTRSDYEPWRMAGIDALSELTKYGAEPMSADEVTSDPGYQFGLDQGQKALDRKRAAQGGRVSGAAFKAASDYATNAATVGYGAAYQRRQDRLNRLQALAGIGQTATSGSAMAGANSSNAISGLLSSQGDANAAGALAQGNIWGGVANQLGAMGKKWITPGAPGGFTSAANSGFQGDPNFYDG